MSRPKHVLLTGGAGFIGAHTVEEILTNTDWTLTIIDRLTYAGNLNRLTDMACWEKEHSRVKFVYHDFRAPLEGKVLELCCSRIPDYIVHMGAESHVANSLLTPRLFAESNVLGTINMLELARTVKPTKFLYVSTDEVYGAVEKGELHKEGEPHNPSNPYSASKAAAEDFVRAYAKSYKVPWLITNTMNNFGERQEREKFIPSLIYNIANGHPVTIHCKQEIAGAGKAIQDVSSRCWLHARNHAAALVYLLNSSIIDEQFNIVGVWQPVDLIAGTVWKSVQKLWGDDIPDLTMEFVDYHSTHPGHDMHYGLDGSKLEALGFKYPVDFVESLDKTVAWTLKHTEWL